MNYIKHSSALAALLTVPFAACADVGPASESGVPPDVATTGVMREALTRNPLEYSNQELMARGYTPRPDNITMPAAYDAWLERASQPMMVIDPVVHESDMDHPTSTSNNWSGIVNDTPIGGYNYVEGQWKVPEVTVDPSTDTYSSTWVGLGGWADTGDEMLWQAGTEQSINAAGTPQYYAWFQMYPYQGEQHLKNLAVSPGDVITAAVLIENEQGMTTNSGQRPMYFISNETTGVSTGWREWGSVTPGQISGSSAEWITERPTKHHATSALANYGNVNFRNMLYIDDSGSHPGNDESSSLTVDMVNHATNTKLSEAVILSPSSAATSFVASN